jgi:hypothetical protein
MAPFLEFGREVDFRPFIPIWKWEQKNVTRLKIEYIGILGRKWSRLQTGTQDFRTIFHGGFGTLCEQPVECLTSITKPAASVVSFNLQISGFRSHNRGCSSPVSDQHSNLPEPDSVGSPKSNRILDRATGFKDSLARIASDRR